MGAMIRTEEDRRWAWPRYNPPGLLVGPLPYIKTRFGGWVPDYHHPGVTERIKIEVDFIEDQRRRSS